MYFRVTKIIFTGILVLVCEISFAQKDKTIADVKSEYSKIAGKYQRNEVIAEHSWNEIASLYGDSSRHYHTLQHLANFYNELLQCQDALSSWNAVFLSMVYHDIIYVAANRDNEEKSADMASTHLTQLGFSQSFIDTCRRMIMATKSHKATNDLSFDLFIDADMSILGFPLEKYKVYVQQVYKEYAAVTNFTELRKGFLKSLLTAERLFITPHFYNLYEKTARNNIQQEIVNF